MPEDYCKQIATLRCNHRDELFHCEVRASHYPLVPSVTGGLGKTQESRLVATFAPDCFEAAPAPWKNISSSSRKLAPAILPTPQTCLDAFRPAILAAKRKTICAAPWSIICKSFATAAKSAPRRTPIPLILNYPERCSSTGNEIHKKTPGLHQAFSSHSNLDLPSSGFALSIGNPAMDLPKTHATSGNATGAAACAVPSLRSGGCVHGLQRTTGQLPRGCARCHRPTRTAS